ncbi:hypothetical protein [Clostridium hydrogenum]|uniref:hypothetical protein n=1 Tax=Clostridium hydrogenum TaxID=2855764 RepID=UPI001F1F2356|nr:hypothetical protein [Clostridium hydrogenum]
MDKNERSPKEKEEVKNLEQNYRVTKDYIEDNKDHMNPTDLKNVREKQANRETQRKNLEWH